MKNRFQNFAFTRFDLYRYTEQQRLQDVFDHFDADNSGRLDASELGQLLKQVIPGVSASQVGLHSHSRVSEWLHRLWIILPVVNLCFDCKITR